MAAIVTAVGTQMGMIRRGIEIGIAVAAEQSSLRPDAVNEAWLGLLPQTRWTTRGTGVPSPVVPRSAETATALLDSASAAAQQVADAAKKAVAPAGDAIEASVERIRELNEQAIQVARTAGQRALDAYQAALESVVDAEQKLAAGSHLDWFTTLVSTQAEFTQRPGAIFLTAAREQLK